MRALLPFLLAPALLATACAAEEDYYGPDEESADSTHYPKEPEFLGAYNLDTVREGLKITAAPKGSFRHKTALIYDVVQSPGREWTGTLEFYSYEYKYGDVITKDLEVEVYRSPYKLESGEEAELLSFHDACPNGGRNCTLNEVAPNESFEDYSYLGEEQTFSDEIVRYRILSPLPNGTIYLRAIPSE